MNKRKKKKHVIKPRDSQSNQELNPSQAIFVRLVFKHRASHFGSNKSGEIKPCFQEVLTEPSMHFFITAKEITRTNTSCHLRGPERPSASTKWKMNRPGVQADARGRTPWPQLQYGVWQRREGLLLGRQNCPATVGSHRVPATAKTAPTKPVLKSSVCTVATAWDPSNLLNGRFQEKQPGVESWSVKCFPYFTYTAPRQQNLTGYATSVSRAFGILVKMFRCTSLHLLP